MSPCDSDETEEEKARIIEMNKTLDTSKILWMHGRNHYAKVPVIKGK
jgi:hypothetical protein